VVRSSLLVALLGSAGCHALIGIDDFHMVDGGLAPDAPADAPGADAQLCYGALTKICRTSTPTGTVIIAGTVNTDSDPRCERFIQFGGPDVCVIAGGTISVENTLALGTRPLVLLAAGSLTVNARLDVSSTRTIPSIGAAASIVPCAASQDGVSNNEAGGGAGGSFGTLGAKGGNGGSAGAGQPGGTANPLVATLTAIRGGCAGGRGGTGGGTSGGNVGSPGGAVALIAGGQIAIVAAGSVFASGGGGGPGSQSGTKGGGGGGGSGGMIVLDAPSIQVLGTLAANGGAGGGGGDGGPGTGGGDGTTVQYTTPAMGGAGQAFDKGGAGGAGFAGTSVAQPGSSPLLGGNGGGGGGGGGAGVIWVHGALSGSNRLSPAAEIH
jgi:hypothetical protein